MAKRCRGIRSSKATSTKGKYIVLKDEDFQRVDLEATQTVDIQDFVDLDEIDPIYFYKPVLPGAAKGRRQGL